MSQNPGARRAYKGLAAQVRRILWEDWDPIGCAVPEDEYDDDVPEAVRLLLERAGRDAVAEYLRRTAAETIGCPVSEDRLAYVLDKLMALRFDTPEGTSP